MSLVRLVRQTAGCWSACSAIRVWSAAALLAGLGLTPAVATAAVTVSTEASRLTAPSPAFALEGGYALDGDTLAVGEQFPSDTVSGSSCIYGVAIRERNLGGANAWGLRKRVVPTRAADCSGAEGGAFGIQPGGVALKGDTLVVSVPHALGAGSGNQAVGRVYVFRRNVGGSAAWGQTAILAPTTESAFQYFGGVVAVSGNTVAVGVQKYASASQASDLAVAVYERNPANEGFSLSRSLSFTALGASGNSAYDGGAQRLSLDGDYLATSLLIRPSSGDRRVLSIFSRNIGGANQWGLDKQFQQENHNGALSLSGTRLAAGRQAENPNGGYNGRVALYERGASGWAQTKTFDIPVRDSISGYDYLYGSAVSLSGDHLLVGHDNSPTPAGRTGSAYLYQRNAGGADSWGLLRQFVAGDARAASYSYPIYQSGTTSALLAVSSPESQVIELFSATATPPVVYDLGDAPSPYAGARHAWGSGLRLGSFVDVEAAQRVGAPFVCVSDYSRDELSGLAGDDDGLESFTDSCNGIARFTIGAASTITVTSNGGGGKLDFWIDANRDGDWGDAGEKLINGLASNGNSTTLANYSSASFSIPLAGASPGASWARLRLSSAGTAQASGDAADGEVEDYPVQLLLPFITAECDAVSEGNAGITSQPCRVRLNTLAGNKPVTHQVKVNYQAVDCGTQIASRATAGSDFVASSGTLTFEPGTATLNLSLQVQGDTVPEPNETYCLKLSNPVNADFGNGDSAARVVAYPLITNDDQVSVMLQAGASINEGAAACVSVRLDQATDHVVSGTVGFSGSATSGQDYTVSSTSFSIAAGSVSNASCQLKITTINDTATESDETIVATVKTASGAKIGTPSTQVFTIKDNDLPRGRLQFGAGSYETSEKAGSVTVSVSRVGGSAGAISVRYATADGSALAGSDYTATAGTLNWAAGETAAKSFTVAIVNDLSGEKSESFSVVLSAPGGGASLGSPASATVSVEDNDCLKLGGLFNLCLF